MSAIRFEKVDKSFGNAKALDGVDLTVADRERRPTTRSIRSSSARGPRSRARAA